MPANQSNRSVELGAFLLRHGVVILLLTLFVGLVSFRTAAIVWHYNEASTEGHRQTAKFAHVLSEHLRQSFATIDATFAHLIDTSTQIGGPAAPNEAWKPVLSTALAGLKGVSRISIIDREGRVRHSTRPWLVGATRDDLSIFERLAQSTDIGLIAHGTMRDPDNGRQTLTLARALTGKSGEFDGIIVAFFDAFLFDEFYGHVDLGPRSVVAIIGHDGELIYRNRPSASLPLLAAAVRRSIGQPQAETNPVALRVPIGTDGEPHFTAIHRVRDMPLSLVVSLPESMVLGAWRKELVLSIAILGTVAVMFIAGGIMMTRALRARAAADAALRKNEARSYEIIYRAPILASVKDPQGRVLFINKEMEQLFGVSWKDAKGKRLKELREGRDGPARVIASLDQEVIDTKRAVQRELTFQTPEGTRTAMFVKFPLLDENGEVDSVASFSVDLTDQRRAATWFRTIMDHAPALIALKDVDGRFVFVNRALADAVGLSVTDFIGRHANELFSKEYIEVHDRFDHDVITARAPIQREIVAPYKPGTRTLVFVKFPIFDAEGNIETIGSIATDITEQKKSEQQLAHAQRMEAIGQLTGGIAHDFNNLLTVMLGNSEILLEELSGNERLGPLARLSLEAAERSAALTQRLLAFGRRQMLEPRPTDVYRLIEDMEVLCRQAAGGRVHVEIRIADESLWPVMVDASQLETAIINLVVNSRDAMPSGGRMRIEMANAEIDDSYVALNPDARKGDYVMIAVSDTGTGMPPEVVARVFEPFFTTKEAGKGTGLGLPTIYGFVRQSGGHIKIYSEVGRGTVVRLYLPRADAPGIAPALDADSTEDLPRGNERVLLVEDDRIVRDYTKAQLGELGYRLTIATGADEAIKLTHLTGCPDLVVTDVVLEGSMNGRELAECLRERWPGLPVLFVSGYTDGALPELAQGLTDGMYFLSKPFRRRDLAVKVREALDGRKATAAITDA